MEIIEYLAGLWKQRLHMFPNPIGAIANDTKPHRILRNQTGIFNFFQGISQIVFTLHLVPTYQMHDAVLIQEVEPKAFGLVPRVPPPRPPCPVAGLARAPSPRLLGTRRHLGAIDPQDQDRAAKATGGHLGHAVVNLGTRRGHIQYPEPLGHLIGEGVQALTTDRDATETAK